MQLYSTGTQNSSRYYKPAPLFVSFVLVFDKNHRNNTIRILKQYFKSDMMIAEYLVVIELIMIFWIIFQMTNGNNLLYE